MFYRTTYSICFGMKTLRFLNYSNKAAFVFTKDALNTYHGKNIT